MGRNDVISDLFEYEIDEIMELENNEKHLIIVGCLKEFKPFGVGTKFGVRIDEDFNIIWIAEIRESYIDEIKRFIKKERLKIITNAY